VCARSRAAAGSITLRCSRLDVRWMGGLWPVKATRRDGPCLTQRRATSSTRPAKRNQHTIAAWSRGVCGRRWPVLPAQTIRQAAPDRFHGIEDATTACERTVGWRSPVQGQRTTTKLQTATANHGGCARSLTVEGTRRARGPWKGGLRRAVGDATNCRIWDRVVTSAIGGPARARRAGRAFLNRRLAETLNRGAKNERR